MQQQPHKAEGSSAKTFLSSETGESAFSVRDTAGPARNQAVSDSWPQGYWENVFGDLQENLVIDNEGLDPTLDDPCDWFE